MAERRNRTRIVNLNSESLSSSDTENESRLQLSTIRATRPILDTPDNSRPQLETTTAATYSGAGISHNNSIRHHTSQAQPPEQSKKSEKKSAITIEVVAPKPAALEPRRQRIRPRVDMDDYSYSASVGERDLYRRPTGDTYMSYVGPGAQTVPYQSKPSFNQNLPYEYHSPDRISYSTVPRQIPNFSPTPTLPPQVPIRSEPERLAGIQDELDRVVRELQTLKAERERKQETTKEATQTYLSEQHDGISHGKVERPSESYRQSDLKAIIEELHAEKERSRKLEIEKEAIQSQAIREAENDWKRRAEADLLAEQNLRQREDEVRKEAERVILAKVENEKKAQEELQLARLEQLQQMMEKLGHQVSVMEKKEADRLTEEKKEEERMKEERARNMEKEALQRMRDEKALQEKAEAERRAEEERLRLKQECEEKERIEAEMREAIRIQEEERIREEKRTQEQERLLQQTIEDAKRQEASRRAADEEIRRRVDEMVKQRLDEKFKAENERVYHDLRRHTNGTLADLQINTIQGHQRPRFLVGNQPQALPDLSNELPASNPFSNNRLQIPFQPHIRDSRSSQEAYQFAGLGGKQFFGEVQQRDSWAHEDQAQLRSHPSMYFPPQQYFSTDDESTASSVPQTPRSFNRPHRGSDSNLNVSALSPRNPYRERQQQRTVPERTPIPQSDPGESFQQYYNTTHSLADHASNEDTQSGSTFPGDFSNRNGSHVIQGERIYTPDGYVTARDGASVQSLESPTQPIHTPPSSSGLGNSGHLTDIEHQTQCDKNRQEVHGNMAGDSGSRSEPSTGSGARVMSEEFLRDQSTPEGQRIRNQPRQMQPPPSGPPAPTPPLSAPPQPSSWQDSQESQVFNGRRPASREVAGFPPSFINRESPQTSQQLQLSSTNGMLNNVPYIMVPLIPGCPIQFSSPAQQAAVSQTSVGHGRRAQAHAGSSVFVNGL